MEAKYVHTNLIARDWRKLAEFYKRVFHCQPVGPERDLTGPLVTAATTIPGAHIRGVHLRLPGYDEHGPTLEIFQYEPAGPDVGVAINQPGFAHIAFSVSDVVQAREEVLAAGGQDFGQLVSLPVPGAGVVTLIYMRDPEGNVIELQSWTAQL